MHMQVRKNVKRMKYSSKRFVSVVVVRILDKHVVFVLLATNQSLIFHKQFPFSFTIQPDFRFWGLTGSCLSY